MLRVDMVRHLVQHYPEMANVTTRSDKTPGKWTPLLCAVETPKRPDGNADLHRVVEALVPHMTVDALLNVSTSQSTVFHQVVARGHEGILAKMLEPLSESQRKMALSMLNGKASRLSHLPSSPWAHGPRSPLSVCHRLPNRNPHVLPTLSFRSNVFSLPSPIGFTFPEGLAPLDLALKSNMRLVKELKAFNAEAATQRPPADDHDAKRRDYWGGASTSWQWQRR